MGVQPRMKNEDVGDSPAKCRERRRRRIEMRRLASATSANLSNSITHHRKEIQPESSGVEKKRNRPTDRGGTSEVSSSSSSGEDARTGPSPSVTEPVFGMVSVAGRSRYMEDAVSASTYLLGPEIGRRRPVHFFAVYDGHGGAHVAALCRENMHVLVQEELTRVEGTREEGESGGGSSATEELKLEEEATWRRVMRRSFERMDEVALSTCACGSVGGLCECHPMQVALGGSTAVVAMLTPDHLIVANCGDSRAVLSRGGRAIPLSNDHKPDRVDELARIEAAGGRVIFVNGARVEGILAMSRAIGDKYLKSVVISEPEISFTRREMDDECLILASDGIWDVVSSELACEVVRECLQKEGTPGAGAGAGAATIDLNTVPQIEEASGTLYSSQSALAAALLSRLALGRKSTDNVSVIVIDLKRS